MNENKNINKFIPMSTLRNKKAKSVEMVITPNGHSVFVVDRVLDVPSNGKLKRRKHVLYSSKPTDDELRIMNLVAEQNKVVDSVSYAEANTIRNNNIINYVDTSFMNRVYSIEYKFNSKMRTELYLMDKRLNEEWHRTTDSASIFINSFGNKVLSMNYNGSRYDGFNPKLIKMYDNSYGYMGLDFKDIHGKPKRPYVHREVYKAFKGEIPKGMQVNHINGVKSDNHEDNLEVVTQAENNKHARDTGLNQYRRLTSEQKESIIELYLSDKELSYRDIALTLDIDYRNVSSTIRAYKKRIN